MKPFFWCVVVALGLSPLGCVLPPGYVYSHTTVPLDVNATGLELAGRAGSRSTKHWTYTVTVEWDGRGIGQIAKTHHFKEVNHADLEVLSVLGVWGQQWVHIYGTRAAAEPTPR